MGRIKTEDNLTPLEEKFALLFFEKGATFGNVTACYREICDTSKMKDSTVSNNAHNFFRRPVVQAKLAELRKNLTERVEFNALNVLKHWVEIATADPNELMQSRRVCCRFCHGAAHQYQWVNEREHAVAVAEAIHFSKRNEEPKLPSKEGGFGFNSTRDPHPHCPECFGEGIHSVYIADTRKLTGAARRLYAGIKYKRDGVEILCRNQNEALENIAKYLGMFKDKLATPPGAPLAPPEPISKVTEDPIEASKIYQKIMGAA